MITNLWYLMVSLVNIFMMSNECLCFFCCCKHSPSFHIFFHFFFIADSFHTSSKQTKQKTSKNNKTLPKTRIPTQFVCMYIIYTYFFIQTVGFTFRSVGTAGRRYIEGRFQNDFPKLLELLIFCRSEELPMSLCVFW